jgi:DNA-binding XRE family transcriptional regulator
MFHTSFAQRLKAARRKYRAEHHCRITQRDLSLRSGISEHAISLIERERCSPRLATAQHLAWALDYDSLVHMLMDDSLEPYLDCNWFLQPEDFE